MKEWEKAKALRDAAEYPRTPSLLEWSKIFAAIAAERQAWLDRYLDAMRVALATAQANPDYQIIVEYLAECSTQHIFPETLLANVLERGCTLTSARVRSFLERDLRLNIWVYQDHVMVWSPHGWMQARGSYPLDVNAIWESWVWYPPVDSEWVNHCWDAADLQEFLGGGPCRSPGVSR